MARQHIQKKTRHCPLQVVYHGRHKLHIFCVLYRTKPQFLLGGEVLCTPKKTLCMWFVPDHLHNEQLLVWVSHQIIWCSAAMKSRVMTALIPEIGNFNFSRRIASSICPSMHHALNSFFDITHQMISMVLPVTSVSMGGMRPPRQSMIVSSPDPEVAAPAPPPRENFRRTAPGARHNLSQRPAPILVDVDAATNSAP